MKKALLGIVIALVLIVVALAAYFFSTYKAVRVPPTALVTATSSDFALPEGFSIASFAEGVKGARVMAIDSRGAMLVSQPSEGRIIALPDLDGDGKADKQAIVASGLKKPHGMAFKGSKLYVAEEDALSSFDYDPVTMKAMNRQKLMSLPSGNGHSTRTLLFMPAPQDNILLISVGSSCNACDEMDPLRAAIGYYDVDKKEDGIYAKGLRNSVFMAIHPVTGEIWATENGRDGLGDDIPPDEVNVIRRGGDYGWPICYGKNVHDSVFDKTNYAKNPCEAGSIPSHIDVQAHSAALGLAFVPEEGWPEDFWFDAFVAYHGSWNRSDLTGYKIVRMKLSAKGGYEGVEDFITGFLRPDGTKIGRPVDLLTFPGGIMYVSDDSKGAIYRVTWNR